MNESNDNNPAATINNPMGYMLNGNGRQAVTPTPVLLVRPVKKAASRTPGQKLAFIGLLVFTALLYLRPQEMFPEVIGSFPLVRIVAIITMLAYFLQQISNGAHLTFMTVELKMLGLIFLLGVLFTPLAVAPADSVEVLLELFIKVVAIFILMINVINTRARLRAIMGLVVICGSVVALLAIQSYVTGDFRAIIKSEGSVVGMRIFGPVGGIVGNPNDLATSLDMLLPLGVVLALTSTGIARIFYLACSAVLLGGVVVTFSRGGFLGLLAMGAILLWKVGRRNRAVTVTAFILLFGVFVLAMPSGYANRISSIFNIGGDPTGSSEARRDLLERAAVIALYNPIIGVGMGNFHVYSIGEKVSHNSYLEIAAELGVAGLIAYLIFIFAPFRSLKKIERETAPPVSSPPTRLREKGPPDQIHFISIALQAVLVAYIVCSFFGSIQYQWFLYYPVAYAIALRRIHAAEQEEQAAAYADSPAEISNAASDSATPRGVLWERYARRGAKAAAAKS